MQIAPRRAAQERCQRPRLAGLCRRRAIQPVGHPVVAARGGEAERAGGKRRAAQGRRLAVDRRLGGEQQWAGIGQFLAARFEAHRDSGRRAAGLPARAAFGRNGIACRHREVAAAGGGISLGGETQRDAGEIGPLQQPRRHAARSLLCRDFAIDGAPREIETSIDRELARWPVGALAGKTQTALVQIGGQQAIALQGPARLHAGERRREMQRVDRQCLHVDADRQRERAAAAVRRPGLLRQRRTHNIDQRGRQHLDADTALEQRGERPPHPRVLDAQPRALLVQKLDLRHLQVGREEATEARHAQGLVGGKTGQRALAGRRLQESKQQPQQRNRATKNHRCDPERAHQKACPRLT